MHGMSEGQHKGVVWAPGGWGVGWGARAGRRESKMGDPAGGGATGRGEVTALLVQTVSQGRDVVITRIPSCGVELGGTGIPNKSARHRTRETF